ncbi:hypothetical protein PoB_000364800 [Plakobranchus ocellatus]|uniref:Secreted protein n=1 Tax=Plakobranchus ocellatus TaxID=259542 RepID=A0AAV3Y486_9GAST|nr:hypothetical protein PoB_000364800 [Plakobranchus ocellatus]
MRTCCPIVILATALSFVFVPLTEIVTKTTGLQLSLNVQLLDHPTGPATVETRALCTQPLATVLKTRSALHSVQLGSHQFVWSHVHTKVRNFTPTRRINRSCLPVCRLLIKADILQRALI